MKTSSKMLVYIMMMTSTLIVLSSSNWLNMWMGMEINLMSFLPILYQNKSNFMAQSCMMYFLIQSLASILFLISIITMMYPTPFKNTINMIIIMSMMMKLGIPPFHQWFPIIISKMNWNNCVILMTWQKIAPMNILSNMMINNHTIMYLIIISSIFGSVMGLNHTSTRKIMAYSSIIHLGWMMACAMMYKMMWMIYLTMYSMMVVITCFVLKKSNISYINQSSMQSMKMFNKIIIFTMLLSMGGMPPFLGFLPKWMTITFLTESNEWIMLLLLMMSSIISMVFYIRMMTPINLNMSLNQKWMLNWNDKSMLTSSIFIINMTLPLMLMITNI